MDGNGVVILPLSGHKLKHITHTLTFSLFNMLVKSFAMSFFLFRLQAPHLQSALCAASIDEDFRFDEFKISFVFPSNN